MPKVILLVLCTMLIVVPVRASSIAQLPLCELPQSSDAIILGEVIDVVEQNNDNLDDLTIRIHAVLKGEIASSAIKLTLSTRGGLKDFDPRLKAGDTGVFFLKQQNGNFSKAYWGSIATFAKQNFSTAAAPEVSTPQLFPRIAAEKQPAGLAVISTYGKSHNWKALAKDTLRLVIQPMGTVSAAYEVNLKSGQAKVFPGSGQSGQQQTFALGDDEMQSLMQTINSTTFKGLAEQSNKIGLDGITYFLEIDLEDNYRWLWRWQPDEPEIRALIELISAPRQSTAP